jgi:serine/threonine protein kinase
MAKRLLVIDGADHGRTYPIHGDGTVTIGNSHRHADICLHDLYVRRVHCHLEVEGERIVARDSENAAGICVNGQPVAEQELRLGDVLRVGNTHMRLEEGQAGEEEEELLEEDTEEVKQFTPAPPLLAERLGGLTDHLLAHYEIGPVLGHGQSGVVFRAHDRKGGHTVALKVLFPEFPQNAAEMQQFAAAMKTVLPLRHANLVTLYNAGRSAPYCWLALEYVEGESFAQVLERMGGLPNKLGWKHALRLGIHLGRALEFIHGNRLQHGNITPRNILIRLSDKVTKLGDLMLARAIDGSVLQKGTLEKKLLEEMPYLAPEQADPEAFVDSLADIYGLGAILYARIAGRPPFQGESPEETLARIHRAPLVRPRQVQSTLPEALDVAITKMLARHQEERYQTAAELVAELERIADEEGVSV